MSSTIIVGPVEGRSIPLQANARQRITGVVRVPDTAYYRRAIMRGDLVLCEEKDLASADQATKEE